MEATYVKVKKGDKVALNANKYGANIGVIIDVFIDEENKIEYLLDPIGANTKGAVIITPFEVARVLEPNI
ncbi:MAG: hypothetical protein M0P12_09840 [Paludibacteraceae bacterium]|nr:hypothetical protein [Paludibacteraceae bacterium]